MAPPIQCGGSRHWPNKIKTQQRNKKIFDKNKQTPVFGRVLIIRIPKSPENHNSSIDYTFFFVSCVVVVIHNGKNALASSNRCQLKVLQVPTQYRHTKQKMPVLSSQEVRDRVHFTGMQRSVHLADQKQLNCRCKENIPFTHALTVQLHGGRWCWPQRPKA